MSDGTSQPTEPHNNDPACKQGANQGRRSSLATTSPSYSLPSTRSHSNDYETSLKKTHELVKALWNATVAVEDRFGEESRFYVDSILLAGSNLKKQALFLLSCLREQAVKISELKADKSMYP